MRDARRLHYITKDRMKKFDIYVSRPVASRKVMDVNQVYRNKASNSVILRKETAISKAFSGITERSENSIVQSTNIALRAVLHSNFAGSLGATYSDNLIHLPARKLSRFNLKKLFNRVGIVVFILALFSSAQTLVINKQATERVEVLSAQTEGTDEQGVEEGTGSQPAEAKPSGRAHGAYQVDPEKPRYIRIPSLSISSRIKEVGDTRNGAVDAPKNIHDAGWYKGSIIPGSKSGVSLLLGHVSGFSAPGVFKAIGHLEVGQIIEIEKGNGEVLRYSVEKTEELPVGSIDMLKVLYEVPAGKQSLRLITCGGSYNGATQSYDSRTLVYANPI